MSADDEIRAINARLAEIAEQDRESQRLAILGELDRGPLSDELRSRIEAFSAEDRARSEQMPDGARTLAIRGFLTGLLADSGITDVLPGMSVRGWDVYVGSATLGPVMLGRWDEVAIGAAERGILLAARADAEARARDASRGGLTRDQIIDAAIANREPDGTWPKQAAVAEALRLADARQIRNVQGPRGWAGIIADALDRLAPRSGGD